MNKSKYYNATLIMNFIAFVTYLIPGLALAIDDGFLTFMYMLEYFAKTYVTVFSFVCLIVNGLYFKDAMKRKVKVIGVIFGVFGHAIFFLGGFDFCIISCIAILISILFLIKENKLPRQTPPPNYMDYRR